MANSFIALIINNTIVIWTDANPADQNYTRRNIIEIGSQCICLHDDFVPWIPKLHQILSNPDLRSMPADLLANYLTGQLQEQQHQYFNDLGLVVAGFTSNGICSLWGLHTKKNFEVIRFPGMVSDGILPTSILSYLFSVYRTIPQDLDNAIDIMLMANYAYNRIGANSALNYPAGSAIVLISQNQNPFWIPAAELANRQAHNLRRLHSLQINMSHQIQGLLK
jgi:hypothetical protein